MAAAGFRSLRLPIDLDLYVASTTGTGDSLAITVSEDLWQVLDAFDTWTQAHGLSLTIDYHQYGTLAGRSGSGLAANGRALVGSGCGALFEEHASKTCSSS